MTERFNSVWDALTDDSGERAILEIKSRLMDEISGYLKRERMTQEEAAELFGVSQPRISDIARGKISRFTIDALIRIAVKAGLTVDLRPARTKCPAVAGKEHGLGIR